MPGREWDGKMAARANLLPLLAVVLLAAPALADHPQPASGDPVTFDHRGGNEWWVEVRVSHPETSGVLARAESGAWQRLDLKSWGAWAASFHIPAGQRVQFQAYQAGGMSDVWRTTSCYFTHPAGAEQCDAGSTAPFAAAFRSPGGNAWWQQVTVDANRPLTGVFAVVQTVNGPEHRPMAKQSWGGWGLSSPAPQGTVVSFLAVSGDEKARSPCWRWTDVVPVDCPGAGPPVADPSQTRFDHLKGNEWWLEMSVGGPYPASEVWARDTDGAWVRLALKDWGAWAGSFRVEPGHQVQAKALVEGAWLESCWYTHPQGLSPTGTQVCEGRYVEG
jgi:hypothetical protein